MFPLLLLAAASSLPAETTDSSTDSSASDGLVAEALQWLTTNGPTFLMNILAVIVILLIAKVVIGIVRKLVTGALERSTKLNDMLKTFLVNIIGKVLWVVTWVLALENLGFDMAAVIAGLGVSGLILGFAFQDTLSNFAAGVMLIANDPFQAGDYVEAGGHAGTVKEVSIVATKLLTPDNKLIILPNKVVWGAPITNYSSTGTRRVDMAVGISYSADITKAKEVIMGILKADERVIADPAPMVEVVEMADSSINLVVRPWSKTADYWGLYFAMQQKIKEALDQAGIEIPFPQRVVHMVKPD